jgi:hypothetical protein
MRYLLMVVLSLVVTGAMGGILIRFFRRLRQIEKERWGSASDSGGRP